MRLCCMKMLLECTAPQRPPTSYKYCIAMKLHGGRCSPWPNVQTRAKLHKGRLGKWIKRDTQSRLDLRRQGLCTAHHRCLINHENIRCVVWLQSGSGWVKEISASLQVWNQKTLLWVWQKSTLELLTLRANVLKKTLVLTVFPQNTMLGRSTGIDQNTLTHNKHTPCNHFNVKHLFSQLLWPVRGSYTSPRASYFRLILSFQP